MGSFIMVGWEIKKICPPSMLPQYWFKKFKIFRKIDKLQEYY